eukprot:5859734-Alexandrium_andersonii.AAC.1
MGSGEKDKGPGKGKGDEGSSGFAGKGASGSGNEAKEPSKASLGEGSGGKGAKRSSTFGAQVGKLLLNMLGNLDLADPAEQVRLAPKSKRGRRRS